MQEWQDLIKKAKHGDLRAFDELIKCFRDMAVGYAYSILSDFQLAEDAAQEAFVQAFRDLGMLREPHAFPSWLRRIVFKYCDRIIRKNNYKTISIEKAPDSAGEGEDPQAMMQKQETQNMVLNNVNELPEYERTVTNLFYINGYSLGEIGAFLDVKESTVKSRLYSARKKLRKRMVNMVKETLRRHAPGEAFNQRVQKILAKVPAVSFVLHQTKPKDGLRRCPESVPFPSCLRAFMEYVGEDLGYKKITVYNRDWRLDTTYVYLMGTTGSAFRLSWKPGWHYDNPVISFMSKDPLEPYRRGMESLGYEYEMIFPKDKTFCESYLRKSIIQSIRDKGRPVIAQGVIGPPEECLITGFDENGKVLIGWSFFQKIKEFSEDVEYEKSGYFRKRNWFKDTYGLIIIEKKKDPPPLKDVYYDALQWVLKVVQTPRVHGNRANGLAAYTAWSDAILQDIEFTDKKVKEIHFRYHVHQDAVGTIAEGRWYAFNFINKVLEDIKAPEVLSKAAECYNDQHDLMWKVWNMVGGPGTSVKKAKLFVDSEIRKQTADFILQARGKDQEAASHIEKALKSW